MPAAHRQAKEERSRRIIVERTQKRLLKISDALDCLHDDTSIIKRTKFSVQ